jgi:ribosomal protein S18 acetylase RimI-like enzyme
MPDGASTNILLSSADALKKVLIPGLASPPAHKKLTPPMGLLLLARLHGQPIGCGALKFHQRRPAELKRMWIAPAARGAGVARRLLGELERTAREAGAVVLRLETNRALSEAIALYKRSGYVEVKAFNAEPYAHHWFEKTLGKKKQSGKVQ